MKYVIAGVLVASLSVAAVAAPLPAQTQLDLQLVIRDYQQRLGNAEDQAVAAEVKAAMLEKELASEKSKNADLQKQIDKLKEPKK